MTFDVGPFALKGGVPDRNGGRGGFCPRRTVLDQLLVDAAVTSGAELRDHFTVDALLWEANRVTGIRGHGKNGGSIEERAEIIVGADGINSLVAKTVQAPEYNTVPVRAAFFYSYFSGIEIEDIEQYVRPHVGAAYFPTHDGLTLVAAAWPTSQFQEKRNDIESNLRLVHDAIPGLKQRLDEARREEKWYGTAGVPGYFRKPYGHGWALVGDAGYDKDPLTAQGITDAFADAENVAEAIDAGLSGREEMENALAAYESSRNGRVGPIYEFTSQLATLEPPPPPMQQLFAALHKNQEATNEFFSALTGAMPLPAFMAPENIGRIMSAAGLAA
jgi:2-polyprenyl-6-methoxyphenol hydroxylase-like FAD-dependent oxidoreductase